VLAYTITLPVTSNYTPALSTWKYLHQIAWKWPIEMKNYKTFLGRGHCSLPRPLPIERGIPPLRIPPTRSAPRRSCLLWAIATDVLRSYERPWVYEAGGLELDLITILTFDHVVKMTTSFKPIPQGPDFRKILRYSQVFPKFVVNIS